MSSRIQILATLKECGVLSSAALFSIAGTASKRAFRYSLAGLVSNGLVSKRLQGASGGKSVYYQLSQDLKARSTAARLLCCSVGSLSQSAFRGRDLPHVEGCGLMRAYLKKRFPDARILSEAEIIADPVAKDLLLWKQGETEFLPDVLLILKYETGTLVSVAFEVERCRKSDTRVVKKLSKYASQTKLDGVVYFCEADHLTQTIRSLYRAKALTKAVRIRYYADDFLLLGASHSVSRGLPSILLNAGGKETNLSDWVGSLAQRKIKNLSLRGKEISQLRNREKQQKNREKLASPATCCPLSPSVTTPHLHSSNVALHASVGSGHGRLVQQVAGEKLKLKTGEGIGVGNGCGDGNEKTGNPGYGWIQGSGNTLGSDKKLKTETKARI